jgi:hypothetical protein
MKLNPALGTKKPSPPKELFWVSDGEVESSQMSNDQWRKKSALASSDSECAHNRITKSPRKSKEHVSPRTIASARHAGRPVSPSPSHLQRPTIIPVHKDALGNNVIEISSDSDAPPSRNKLPPLMLAKRKVHKKATSPVESCRIFEGGDDIIDLT